MSEGTRLVAGYHRLEVVYRGETSTIYRGLPDGGAEPVAIKVLRDPAGAGEVDRLTALSGAPGIVAALDHGQTTSGRTYVVMPFHDGDWAARCAQHHPIPVTEVVLAARAVADALTAVHGRDLLHHGVQPSNLLCGQNTTVLTDFGAALPLAEIPEPPGPDAYEVPHAPPEALRGDPPSPASDVYRLASTVWTLLGGHLPYADPDSTRVDPFDYRDRALTSPPPRIPRADLSQGLRDVVRRAMSVSVDDRFSTAADFAAALVASHPAAAAFITPAASSDGSSSPIDGEGKTGEGEDPSPDRSRGDSDTHNAGTSSEAAPASPPAQSDAATSSAGPSSRAASNQGVGTAGDAHTKPSPDGHKNESKDESGDTLQPSAANTDDASGAGDTRSSDAADSTTTTFDSSDSSTGGATSTPDIAGSGHDGPAPPPPPPDSTTRDDAGTNAGNTQETNTTISPEGEPEETGDTLPHSTADSDTGDGSSPPVSADVEGHSHSLSGDAQDAAGSSPDDEDASSQPGTSDAASGQAAIAGLVERLRQATDAAQLGPPGGARPEDAWAALPGWSGSTATPSAAPQQSPPAPMDASAASHPHAEPPPNHQQGQQSQQGYQSQQDQQSQPAAAPAPPPPPDYSGISAPPRQRPALIAVAVIAIGFLAITAAAVAFLRPGLGGDLIASIRDSDGTDDASEEEDQSAPLEEAPDAPPAPPAEQNPEAAPTDVEIVEDLGHEVVLSWTDNSSGAGSHHVVGGQSGAVPGNLVDTDPGETEARVSGLNTEVDYCFTVISVLSVDDVASAEQVCTTRETEGEDA